MGRKNMSHDAEYPSRSSFVLNFVRTLAGAALFAGLWLILGWALHSLLLGKILCIWSFAIGPLVVPSIYWLSLRRLRAIPIAQQSALAHEYFHGILYQPGPRPRLWLMPSTGMSFFWFENIWSFSSRQELVLTSKWLEQPDEMKVKDWRILWKQMASKSLRARKLRSLQMCYWAGAISPLASLFEAMVWILDRIGFADLPNLKFFGLRLTWDLKEMWFGTSSDRRRIPQIPQVQSFVLPQALTSLLWGVWLQVPSRNLHPTWMLLTHSEVNLEFDAFKMS